MCVEMNIKYMQYNSKSTTVQFSGQSILLIAGQTLHPTLASKQVCVTGFCRKQKLPSVFFSLFATMRVILTTDFHEILDGQSQSSEDDFQSVCNVFSDHLIFPVVTLSPLTINVVNDDQWSHNTHKKLVSCEICSGHLYKNDEVLMLCYRQT